MTDHEAHVSHLRKVRDQKLAASDFSQLPDVFDEETRAEWAAYRQLLRDFPGTFPGEISADTIPSLPLSPPERKALEEKPPLPLIEEQ